MTNTEERREEARRALEICVATRKRIDAYIRMTEKDQGQQNPEEIASCFEHLWDCDNAWALEALTGSRSGSGLCRKKFSEIAEWVDKNPHNFRRVIAHHIARIVRPDIWAWFLHDLEKNFGKPDMTPHYQFMYQKLEEWEQNHSRRK